MLFHFRLKEAQQTVQKITAEKKVETKKINANSLVRKHFVHNTLNNVNNTNACVHPDENQHKTHDQRI